MLANPPSSAHSRDIFQQGLLIFQRRPTLSKNGRVFSLGPTQSSPELWLRRPSLSLGLTPSQISAQAKYKMNEQKSQVLVYASHLLGALTLFQAPCIGIFNTFSQ